MGRLTTHVLDTAQGRPAAGVRVAVSRIAADGVAQALAVGVTNADGRLDAPLLENAAFGIGVYELTFHIGAYFAASADAVAMPFLDVVPIRFGVADDSAHYHVPLLVTPWSYATYRGS